MSGRLEKLLGGGLAALAMAATPLAAAAQGVPIPAPLSVRVPQTSAEAGTQDASHYARRFGVSQEEAEARLRALQASAALTDRIRDSFRERLVGVSIDHVPTLRIVVLLAGNTPVTDTSITVEGLVLPIYFRTGAPATVTEVARAMIERGPAINALLPRSRGMGLDPRTGELVILLAAADAVRPDLAAIQSQAEALTGVRVRFDRAAGPITNLSLTANASLAGGGRIVGVDPADGRRYACTTGFAVTDGVRSGLVTAAHCPDAVDYVDATGTATPLTFVGQWGVSTQDVQVHLSPLAQQPYFYADRKSGALRKVGGARTRMSTRAGEWLCRYGEGSGYGCAEVEMTHFAPAAPLCAGPCAPTWVTVRTHQCKSGDSGGPVFSGDLAFGITKGGSGGARCNFYFYMSTDFLPAGWRLLR